MRRPLILAGACAVVICVAVALAVIAIVPDRRAERLTRAQLQAVEDRVWAASENGDLARVGIFLAPVLGDGKSCVNVYLVNPTQPNIEYLRHRFGPGLCVAREPMTDDLSACTGFTVASRVPDGIVVVPSITGQAIEQAQRRLVRRNLRFAYGCPADFSDTVRPPDQSSPDRLATVVDQCPRAGERVRSGTPVYYRATAMLPGGYVRTTGELPDYNEVDGHRPVCENRRDLWRPRPELDPRFRGKASTRR
jgi:hypothetical protein